MYFSLWQKPYLLDDLCNKLTHMGLQNNLTTPLAQQAVLLNLIDEHALWLTPTELAEQVTAFKQRNNLATQAAFALWLKQRNLTEATFTQQLGFITAQQRLKEAVISPADIETAFLNKKTQLETVTFLMISVATMAEAHTLVEQLRTADMTTLARQVSLHPSAVHGGLVGPLPWAKLTPHLRQQLSHQPMGEVIAPFLNETGDAALVVRLLRHTKVELTPELYTQLIDEQFNQWLSLQVKLATPTVEVPALSR